MIKSGSAAVLRATPRQVTRAHYCALAHSPRPTARPLAPPSDPPHRTFTSTPTPRKRGDPIKLLPEFSWRRAWRGYPVPVVEVVNNADDAEAVLETLTSRRLSIDAEQGNTPGATLAQRGMDAEGSKSVRNGVLSIADGEGVVMLHLANMDRFPKALRQILEDESIEKQLLGAAWWIREILRDSDYYGCEPRNILDLRRLAEIGWPVLAEPEYDGPHDMFTHKFAKDMLEVRYAFHTSTVAHRDFRTQKLQGQRLEVLINQAWFTHCAGSEIHAKVRERIAFKIDRGVLPVPDFLKPKLVDHVLEEAYKGVRYDAASLKDQLREFDEERLK